MSTPFSSRPKSVLLTALAVALAASVLAFCSLPSWAAEEETPPPTEEPAEPSDPEADPAEPDDPADEEPPGEGEEPPVPVRPELAFEEGAIVLSGLSPEGEAVVFGVGRRWLGYHQRVERFEEVVIADVDGAARFESAEELPASSVWAVVDLPTGEIALGSAPGFDRTPRELPTAALRGRGGVPNRVRQALESAHLLYVRPGEGAWGIAALEGAVFDRDDADDGEIELALEDLVPSGTTGTGEPPAEFAAGDVLVMVDPTDLTLFSLRVTPDALH